MKEMLAKAFSDKAPAHHRQLADSTTGLVFYACPHLGSNLANIGWNLRYVGASPAASVVHLKPGKHLEVSQCLFTTYLQRYIDASIPGLCLDLSCCAELTSVLDRRLLGIIHSFACATISAGREQGASSSA